MVYWLHIWWQLDGVQTGARWCDDNDTFNLTITTSPFLTTKHISWRYKQHQSKLKFTTKRKAIKSTTKRFKSQRYDKVSIEGNDTKQWAWRANEMKNRGFNIYWCCKNQNIWLVQASVVTYSYTSSESKFDKTSLIYLLNLIMTHNYDRNIGIAIPSSIQYNSI